ncbi:MAG: hypothetical protein D4R66_03135 [Opitutales bacterium]|jgi:hypothetical protein|nr:MAG: hypothetical protein D4R66_03135 [Opitutales bacterium]
MPSLLRSTLILLGGIVLGALATLSLQPSFSIVMTNAPAAAKTEAAPAAPKPESASAPEGSAGKSASVASALPTLDYAAINERPALWPTSVVMIKAYSSPVLEGGKKISETTLAVGDSLQVSKVFGAGFLEVRSRGVKFEIDSRLTNFEVLIRKKAQELFANGSNQPMPYIKAITEVPAGVAPAPTAATPVAAVAIPVASAAVASPAMVPAVVVAAPAEPEKPVVPKGPATLDEKLDTLFGRKSALAPPSIPSADPSAPAAEVAKPADAKEDLDKKINTLFKSSRK